MDEYYEQLVRGGIAPGRARRLLREFTEHGADIARERLELGESAEVARAAALARLGNVQDFVSQSLARPELKSFSARRPWAAFAVAPLFTFAALMLASGAAVYGFVMLYRHVGDWNAASLSAQRIALAAQFLVLWITPLLSAAGVALFAAIRRQALLWPVIGILLISFVSSLINFQVGLPAGHDQGQLAGGIGISSDLALLASTFGHTAARTVPVLALLLWLRSRRFAIALD